MFSDYVPLTLDDWIRLDKEKREGMNEEIAGNEDG